MAVNPNANQAELSTAAVGACDEPADAVGNSGLRPLIDFVLVILHCRLSAMRAADRLGK